MNNTFFSIVIPTFNSGQTLENCLKSILNQTYTDFEVLMMDGVSTDDTLQIASSFNDDRIRIYSEPDKGIYDAMNKGIDLAKGKWLYFLGSDDEFYDKNVLSEINKKTANSINKVIYGNVLIVGDSGWAKHGDIYNGYFDKKNIIMKNICHQSIFYYFETFKKIGNYDIKYHICADHEFNIRACAKFPFKYIDLITAKFKGGGLSSKPDFEFLKDFENIIIENHWARLSQLNVSNKKVLNSTIENLKKVELTKALCLVYSIVYRKIFARLLKNDL